MFDFSKTARGRRNRRTSARRPTGTPCGVPGGLPRLARGDGAGHPSPSSRRSGGRQDGAARDHQRIDRHAALRAHDHRVDVEACDQVAEVVRQHARAARRRRRGRRRRRRARPGRRRAADGSRAGRSARAPARASSGGSASAPVAEQLDQDAAGRDQHQRPELRVADDAERDLDAGRGHRPPRSPAGRGARRGRRRRRGARPASVRARAPPRRRRTCAGCPAPPSSARPGSRARRRRRPPRRRSSPRATSIAGTP